MYDPQKRNQFRSLTVDNLSRGVLGPTFFRPAIFASING